MDIITCVASYVLCFIGGWVVGKCREDYRMEHKKSKTRPVVLKTASEVSRTLLGGKFRAREN